MLHLLATLDRFCRRGLLGFESFMGILSEAAKAVVLSLEAFVQVDEIRQQMMRGLH
jgi:hypothetical protein